MNAKPGLPELTALAAIVSHRSFRKAADELGLSPSTLSHMMRTLERGMGVRLLNRTTRSVAPTEAGEQLLARLRPALVDIREAVDQVTSLRNKPAGRVRLLVPRLATTACAKTRAACTRLPGHRT